MSEDIVNVEDLGVKIGTEEQRAWEDLKKKLIQEIKQSQRIILMNEELVKLADKKIQEEQDSLK
jgi:hypothetical protein